MSVDQLSDAALMHFANRLCVQHRQQILNRAFGIQQQLEKMFAITFRPGDRTSSFHGKLLRPLGAAVLVALYYDRDPADPAHVRMPLRGYRLNFEVDGSASYGCHADPVFHFDGAGRPKKKAWGERLNPQRNASLVDLLLRMDRYCISQRGRVGRLPTSPKFPRILLGFTPDRPPIFEDTPALRRLAADRLGQSVERLGANGDLLLTRLLEDVWHQQLIHPAEGINDTGLLLMDSELCTQVLASLRVFEDFSGLVGVQTWNPAREVKPFQAENPAKEVLREFGIDPCEDYCQTIPASIVKAMLDRMKVLLGSRTQVFTDEEILDGITAPDRPLTAWSQALPELRKRLNPYFAEVATDDDLLRATRQPDEPLFASGACRIQSVRRRRASDHWDLFYTPEDLSRSLAVDLTRKATLSARVDHPATAVDCTLDDSGASENISWRPDEIGCS